ncbi:prophage antirepressor-like protein [Herbaspirillum sp. Sphag1AN]|uniref:BRO family protein n=1 Tax=unclassified Herbaspirillum TaxID=2624150 RepID=UPI0017976C05|nr:MULTISPECIES: BRO family protein [unclassified Herbaspirillum]MBB3213430.1 prophage antirepressor-like protein [Herbaspirillum sp. Sphag1AN]MBB3246526.1 prophage antirepressor-like protein [Herbaspirillum sp. Sphag64]
MQELMFQDTSLRLVERDGKQWVGAADIARALGYAEPGKVTRLYDRHKAEFSQSMTRLFEMPTLGVPGNLRTKTRFFSLRGAHLVAMFARTSKGQEFRRWVLDLIESQTDKHKSLLQLYYEAKADELAQERFASLCGRGLSEHKRVMPPKRNRVNEILSLLQPSLQLT